MPRENLIQDRTFKFSLEIISLYKQMIDKREYVLSKQVLRSGTSIGANVEEALAGQSKRDFLSKMTISLKETRETHYWLRLIKESRLVDIDLNEILKESTEITNIISSIVKTTKQSINNS